MANGHDGSEVVMERKRIAYIDNLRVAATFAVIMIHVAAQNWYSQDVNTAAWKAFNFYDSISRWAVPVFVMMSGALMLEKDISLKELYAKRIPHFLIVFLFWSLVYALIEGGSLNTILMNVVCGKNHQWFIYLIVGLYICIPIMKKIVEDQRITVYFLAVSLVLSFVIPFLLRILTDFGGATWEAWAKAFTNAYNDMNITVVSGYAVYFVAGYYLNRTEISKPVRIVIYAMGVLGTIITIVLSFVISIEQGVPVDNYYEYLNLNILMQSVAVFVWFAYNTPAAGRINAIAGRLSAYSFGVYLVHIMVLDVLKKQLALTTLSFNPILAVPVLSAIVFVISCAISAVIRKIPILKDYII